MIIELLGTRLIAPFYGSSLYVWTSVISVTMIALAVGYFVGGYWADRTQRAGLALIIALAGCLTLSIPWLVSPVLLATDSLGLRLGSFISTLALFSPSLLMLGMVSPFAVKLATSSLSGVGVSTGSIYAVSTIGSVIGTLLLGFFLFPTIGSREIIISLGLILLAVAIAVSFIERKKRSPTYSHLPIILVAIFGFGFSIIGGRSQPAADESYQTHFKHESLYGWVRVIDNASENFRVLTMDSSIIGAASLSNGRSALSYQRAVEFLPGLRPGMKRALLIGQGAGHMASELATAGITTDTMEIDPAIAEAATEFFGFSPTGTTIIGDARYEVRRLDQDYDLIILDVFTGGAEPFHLLTVEYLQQLQSLLTDNGMLALNFVAFYDSGTNQALASVVKTLDNVFSYQQTLISEPDVDFNDFIFLASDTPIELNSASLSPRGRNWLRERAISINSSSGSILTDNLNPLEHLQIRKSENYRRVVVDLIGIEQLIR